MLEKIYIIFIFKIFTNNLFEINNIYNKLRENV